MCQQRVAFKFSYLHASFADGHAGILLSSYSSDFYSYENNYLLRLMEKGLSRDNRPVD